MPPSKPTSSSKNTSAGISQYFTSPKVQSQHEKENDETVNIANYEPTVLGNDCEVIVIAESSDDEKPNALKNDKCEVIELMDDDDDDVDETDISEDSKVAKATDDPQKNDPSIESAPSQESPVGNSETAPQSDDSVEVSSNPFAKFAFSAPGSLQSSTPKWVRPPEMDPKPQLHKRKPKHNDSSKNKKPKQGGSCDKQFIPVKDLSPDEQARVRTKWHGLADPSAPLETKRFQVMVASRLHARCQESVVRKCMDSLRESGVLASPQALSETDPRVLVSSMKSLQYHNVKAQHLVKASKQLIENFGGRVPERHADLMTITGIGPVMADLLSTVNTRASYESP